MSLLLSYLVLLLVLLQFLVARESLLFYLIIIANTPVDVVKTQMQGLNAAKYNGAVDCFFQTLKNEGIRGLYKGTVPRLSRVVLDVALTFTLYEKISAVLNKLF